MESEQVLLVPKLKSRKERSDSRAPGRSSFSEVSTLNLENRKEAPIPDLLCARAELLRTGQSAVGSRPCSAPGSKGNNRMWHQPRSAIGLQSVGLSDQHLNNQKPERGILIGIMRQYPGNAAWKPHTFGFLSHYPPISPQIRPSWACP